ncbi:MAG: DUF1513 domain-containing protein [Proteobacteria bacterium]|nr:DUF1513 domain-containing protein [Pseudomonadota bacterium]
MAINRRKFLAGALASGLGGARLAKASSDHGGFISSAKIGDNFAAIQLDEAGRIVRSFPLPDRGHDIALSPSHRQAVAFSRRPGNFAVVLDLESVQPAFQFKSPANRHFYGHGFFSSDGKLLFATENDFDAELGCLGVYDARDGFRRVGEYDCHGIGPHEALLLSDRKTIACAIGGIATHPDYPRQKLNLAEMAPSLVYLDYRTGSLIEQVFMPSDLYQLSLRHIVEGPDSTIWFCGQYEGPATEAVPIVGFHKRGQPLRFIDLPPELNARARYYAGSIAINGDWSQVAVSFPRGNFLVTIDSTSKRLSGLLESSDICGIAGAGKDFLASNGQGELLQLDGTVISANRFSWDNHLRAF